MPCKNATPQEPKPDSLEQFIPATIGDYPLAGVAPNATTQENKADTSSGSGDELIAPSSGSLPNTSGPAAAAPDELRKAYFEGYEDALKDRSAPAEVAEGAGEDTLTAEERRIAQIYASARDSYPGHQESAGTLARACLRLERALRAAPSLSREEWQILSAALAVYAMGDANLTALRAKVREQEREGKDG
jgi:hypothetical protein